MKVKDIIAGNDLWHPGASAESQKPTVSILLPTFRRGKSGLFRNAVESVTRQTMTNFELIIVDDASTDGTYDQILEFMERDSRISCIRHKENVGLPAISEYEAFMKSRGEYIAFMFDDVEWEPRALEMMLDGMLKADLQCAFGRMLLRNDPADLSRGYTVGGGHALHILQNLDSHNFIANASLLVRREVLNQVGLYDPHVSMVRICDWDLLRRIIRDYHLESVDAFVGYENGYITNDSIGHTMKLDSWVASERIQADRKIALQPMNYHEVDVLEIHDTNTQYFRTVVKELSTQYSAKHWYRNARNRIGEENKTIPVLVISPESVDASTTLCFGRGSYPNACLRTICANIWQFDQLSGAACAIMIRSLTVASNWKDCARKLGIPMYYFIDDNLPSVSRYIEHYKDYSIDNVKTWLTDYNGVLTSSIELAKYYLTNNLHKTVYYFPPIIGDILYNEETKFGVDKPTISIAFMGSPFRNESLIQSVWPAIGKLSEIIKIKFYCPPDALLKPLENSHSNVDIIYVPRIMSLEQMLFKYNRLDIDIVVHPGPDIENNRYKTLNSLLNAVQVGAVLMVPDRAPFNRVDGRESLFVTIEDDSPNGWLKGLRGMLDRQVRREMVKRATEFCLHHYGGEQNRLVIQEITRELDEVGCLTRAQRLSEIHDFRERPMPVSVEAGSSVDMEIGNLPEFQMKPSPTLRPPFQFRYRVVPDVDWFESIGVRIGTCGSRMRGSLVLRIFAGRNPEVPLRVSRVPLLDAGDEGWMCFKIDPLRDCLGQELVFAFSMENASLLSCLSIFEAGDCGPEVRGRFRALLNGFKMDRHGVVIRFA